jgi:hypothetical protein
MTWKKHQLEEAADGEGAKLALPRSPSTLT